MEVDSGAYATVISKKTDITFFPNHIFKKPDNYSLNAWGKIELKQEDIIYKVNVEILGRKAVLELFVL